MVIFSSLSCLFGQSWAVLCCSRTGSLRFLKPPYECTDRGFISAECCSVARCYRFFHFSCVATELFLRELCPFDRAAAWVGTFSTSAWQWPRSQSQALRRNCFPSLVWKNWENRAVTSTQSNTSESGWNFIGEPELITRRRCQALVRPNGGKI